MMSCFSFVGCFCAFNFIFLKQLLLLPRRTNIFNRLVKANRFATCYISIQIIHYIKFAIDHIDIIILAANRSMAITFGINNSSEKYQFAELFCWLVGWFVN